MNCHEEKYVKTIYRCILLVSNNICNHQLYVQYSVVRAITNVNIGMKIKYYENYSFLK